MLFGALIAYRIIYYLLPLVISGIVLFSYEGYQAHRLKKIKEQHKLTRLKNYVLEKANQLIKK